jgi:hypothetical protein
MPGHSSLPYAGCENLSALPVIHVFLAAAYQDVDGRDPPMPEASTGFDCLSAETSA